MNKLIETAKELNRILESGIEIYPNTPIHEKLKQALNIACVTSSFSLMILEAEYHKLKLEIFKAEKEMALSPNEYSYNFIDGYKPHLQDLEKAISVLQNYR